jgi:hypothetical protein
VTKPAKAPSTKKSAVLGAAVLKEILDDQARLELPSYVTAGPRMLGSTEHHMTADKRRSVATIHLVITLVRLWGHEQGRKRDMLENYMHLVVALQIASMRAISDEDIECYTHHYKKYLEGFVQLYKEVPVHPNNHMCLHLGIFLRLFGPVHSWRSWVFERYNYLLQNITTNSRFGKIFIVVCVSFFNDQI